MRRNGFVLALLLLVLTLPTTKAAASHQHTRVEVNIWLHGGPDIAPIKDLETLVGVKFDGAKWYGNWDEPWRAHIPNGYHANGYIPEFTWQPMLQQPNGTFLGVANSDILSGVYDSYLDATAINVKALPYRLRIAFAAEFNGWWNPWGLGKVGNTVDNHKLAWRYIVDRFKQKGVSNVDWIWTPNVDPFHLTPSFASMYPGDAYVTYFGLDGYNFSTTNGPYWMSFDQVFEASYNELQAISAKDVYLIEVGSVEEGGSKAAWIKDMFDKLETGYPRIKGLTWWNVAYPQYDMRIESSETAKAQFAASMNGASSSGPASSGSTTKKSGTNEGGVATRQDVNKAPAGKRTDDPGSAVAAAPPDTGFSLPSVIRRLTPDKSSTIVWSSVALLFLLTTFFFVTTRRALRSSEQNDVRTPDL